MRLDVYLINNHLATDEQVREAMDYQRSHGDRLENHLFRFGYVSESDLVRALSKQFCYPGVTLSDRAIPLEVLALLPTETVWEKQVVPFEYDASTAKVKVACENPRQPELRQELAARLPDKSVELHIALGVSLRLAILRFYRQQLPDLSESEEAGLLSVTGQLPVTNLEEAGRPDKQDTGSESAPGDSCHLLLLDTARDDIPTLGQILQYQGYLVTSVKTVERFLKALSNYKPQIQVLQIPGDRSALAAVLSKLIGGDSTAIDCPSYLVIDDPTKEEINDLLQVGFEDVIASENVLDLMMIKLRRTRERICRERRHRHDILKQLGTHGSLDDMNLIDLLQALGPTAKTARLSVSGEGRQLTIFIDKGRMVHAECDEDLGAEAVYRALGWQHGVWSMDPISPDNLPEPNINITNEAILLEGCRRLDEGAGDSGSVPVDDLLAALDQYD